MRFLCMFFTRLHVHCVTCANRALLAHKIAVHTLKSALYMLKRAM